MDNKFEIIRVKLDEPKLDVFKETKARGVNSFNFKLIKHFKAGERVFIYPSGTIGGGEIGLLPKKENQLADKIKETIQFDSDGKDIFMEILVERGSQKPKSTIVSGCLGLLLGVAILFIFVSLCSSPSDEVSNADQVIEKNFSPLDGSHIELSKIIKANIKDPDSYEHIETTYRVQGDTIWVFTNYRAKNSFGGFVVEGVTGITDKNTGQVLEWMMQDPQ